MDVNVEQGKSTLWKGRCCERCGRSTEEATLNIEATIHHHDHKRHRRLECVDRKECAKHTKRRKK